MSIRIPFRRLAARLTGRRREPGQKAAWLRRPDRRDFIIAGLSLVVFGFLVLGYLAYTLPLADTTRPERRMSLLLRTSNGEPFGSRGIFRGTPLTFEEIPKAMVDAVLAMEDRRFYDHFGVDILGVARAALTNVMAGEIREGGSTITQQLAKIMFLSPERTYTRKIQELMIALWLERRLTKNEILTRYLNTVYFGAGAYGVDGAAWRYFNKSARRLTLSEAAMLAGLVQAPTRYAPTRDIETARQRAEIVLSAMVDAGYIDETAAAEARSHPARLAVPPDTKPDAGYFADWVEWRARRVLGPIAADLEVWTTLDPELQKLADRTLRKWIEAGGKKRNVGQAALVAMTHDGAVLAMSGGVDYAESKFNRVTQAERQPGSAFKLFVYLAAFDQGFTPDSRMVDRPVTIDGWQPDNYSDSYRGEVTLRQAFAQSINTVAVQLAQKVGINRVIGVAQLMGIDSPLRPELSLALGTSEVTLLELTGAYAGIAADAKRVEPYGIRRIRGPGQTLYRHTAEPDRSGLPWKREAMLDLLINTVRNGTGKAAAFGRPAAGKTGTSQDYRDAWFIGFTADVVVGVWVGNDDGTPMKGVTGGGLPALIWRDFMKAADALKGGAETPSRPLAATPPAQPDWAVEAAPKPVPVGENGSFFDRLGARLRQLFE